MGLLSEIRILYKMIFSPVKGSTHQERLESFYREQARDYEAFRKRLLHGRTQLYRNIPCPEGGIWVDLGGGTGSNLDEIGPRIKSFRKVYLVDLTPSLVEIAKERIAARGWTNVEAVLADVTEWAPPEGTVDTLTFSYSLTMIPAWYAALEQALRILKPGGHLGVVDFYVSRKYTPTLPNSDRTRKHSWFTRHFWPIWFATDNVHPNRDHLPYLLDHLSVRFLKEGLGSVPYLTLFTRLRAPYYVFVGRRS
jgi:S-adenosylmethionine-diacylgycerolhomoserine-N-methlytransferase